MNLKTMKEKYLYNSDKQVCQTKTQKAQNIKKKLLSLATVKS